MSTGGVLARAELDLGVPGIISVEAVAARPDGGVTALVSIRSEDGAERALRVVDLDEQLEPVGEPVDPAPGTDRASSAALAVTPDGAAVLALAAGPPTDSEYRLVVVRDGAVAGSSPLPSDFQPAGLTTDPTSRSAYVPLTHASAEATLATVDLATGSIVSEVPLCTTSGSFANVVLAADGRSVAVTGICDDRAWTSSAFLVG